MKNQYVGDIGDFGKYAMLRAFLDAGISVGVNWYLTEDDGSNDGKYKDYLQSTKDNLRRLAPDVFDELKKIVCGKKKRTVKDIEKSNLLRGAAFHDAMLKPMGNPSQRKEKREAWFEKGFLAMEGMELVFLDPDNGLLESDDPQKRGAEKYALPSEVKRYFDAGHNVVYYCHKGRRTKEKWEGYKRRMLKDIPSARQVVLTYRRGTQRSYVFLLHEGSFERYDRVADDFYKKWPGVFVREDA